MAKAEVHLGVRELVEFFVRSGSIDRRFKGFDRMQEGTRIHRRLQKQAEEGYQPEVYLSHTCTYQGTTFTVDGRADGIITRLDGITIDEIKTTAMPFSYLHEDFCPTHWAQLQCYGYFVCLEQGLEHINLRLTYYQVETDEIVRYVREYTLEQLQRFYLGLLWRWNRWVKWQQKWMEKRDISLRRLKFPFPRYRDGQRAMAVAVYRTTQRRQRLLCQAPTGTGKTISTLFPALKAMGEGLVDRIFYLTARTTTRLAAQQAIELMRGQKLRVKSVTLTAREKICPRIQPDCRPETCPYAVGFYDRINDVLLSLLEQQDRFGREDIAQAAQKYRLCPYELGMELSYWCDVIVGDYNHLFDPMASLRRFFSDKQEEEYLLLIDEAHNLVDRSREMYSATLTRSRVMEVRRVVGRGAFLKALEQLSTEMTQLAEQGQTVMTDLPLWLCEEVEACVHHCEGWLNENKGHVAHRMVMEFYRNLMQFQRITQLYGSGHVTDVLVQGEEVCCRLLCLDASTLLDACMARGRTAVLFSATLSPMEYYQKVLGAGAKARRLTLRSPFDRKNLCLLAVDINLRYAQRQGKIPQVCRMLYTMISARRGNYLAFFPSYQYLKQVYEAFCGQYPEVETLMQQPGMEEQERTDFLHQFRAGGAVLGFAVLGGVYAEGVDLAGERLIGVAIVSVGLPQICRERDLLREHCEQNGLPGFEFAYQYPGMDRVMQAAGRVIRTAEDKGVVLLLDSRFSEPQYRILFPAHWKHCKRVSEERELEQALHRFWKEDC